MSEASDEFLEAYDTYRVADQVDYYEQRTDEYEASAGQIGWASELLLAAAAACGVVAVVWTDQAAWLGVAAAALAALGTALTAWGDVIGFAANAELYRTARAGLGRLRPDRPTPQASAEQVEQYMVQVEDVLLGEVRAWGDKWGGTDGDGG